MDEQKKVQNESASAYDPKTVETRIYAEWMKRRFFTSDQRHGDRDKEEGGSSPSTSSGTKSQGSSSTSSGTKRYTLNPKRFTILLPPPNITGSLHMGHALNATISDILIRYHRMRGEKTAWLPGIDHAGIAAQNVVEKNLRKENISRFDLGREKFIAKVWEWKEKYGNIILDQLKRLGASCDWSRTRFTMDAAYSEWVLKAFVHYYEKGLIYRGKRLISWCPRCQTSLSDLEIEYKEETGKLYYIRYPLISRNDAEIIAERRGKNLLESAESTPSPQSPLKSAESASVVVATTRPETMLGDAAVAVNPKDKRYKQLIGRTVRVPLTANINFSRQSISSPQSPPESAESTPSPQSPPESAESTPSPQSPPESAESALDREIPIVADAAVDEKFGTGMVKVTPAHDLLDSEIGTRHKLPVYEVINERGHMQNVGPVCDGLKTSECREKVVLELQAQGLLEKVEDLKHNLAVCYRCNTTLEPLLSNQWFLKMGALAKKTSTTVKSGKTKIIPKNFGKPFFEWLKNIKDWCVSRQIWWGHQLPVYFCTNNGSASTSSATNNFSPRAQDNSPRAESRGNFIVSLQKPAQCPICKQCEMQRSSDVLDTWFSSALWPFAGFREEDVKQFYPSNVLITARDIINLWVGRMIFSGLEFMKKTPFTEALIHGTILTKDGKRMSKSLGTGIDPVELIEKYGADATRFGIVWQAMGNQDIRWDEAAVVAGKKFANKIWNASRFVSGRIGSASTGSATNNFSPRAESRGNLKLQTLADKKITSALAKTKKVIEKLIIKYEFGQALHELYDFFWHEFCDVYLEASKLQTDPSADSELNENTNAILSHVLFESLKMLHPFMPHITEEIFQNLPHPEGSWLIVEKW